MTSDEKTVVAWEDGTTIATLENAARYGGLLGALAETCDIAAELGIPAEDAAKLQRERAAARYQEYLEAVRPSNVIQFPLDRVRQTDGAE